MKRLLVPGLAACVLTIAPSLSASAMPLPKQIVAANRSDVIRVHAGGHSQYGWHPTHGHGSTRGHHRGQHQK
jgi:hypothetical protein